MNLAITTSTISGSDVADSELAKGLVTELKVGDGDWKTVTNGTVDITDEIRVEADEDVQVEVRVKLNDDFNAIDSGDELYVVMDGYEYESDSYSGIQIAGENGATSTENTLAVYNTEPTITTSAGSASSFGNTYKEIMTIDVTADEAGRVTLNTLSLDVAKTGTPGDISVKLVDDNGNEVEATTTSGQIDLPFSGDIEGRISAGTTETYSVEVKGSSVTDEDSVIIELIEGNFDWSDDEAANITTNLDLIDDLSGSYELIR
jgi:hypothetical protein